jgi:hypothetical protein
MNFNFEDFDDGHNPGSTEIKTKIAILNKRICSEFVCVFENVLPDIWCDHIYEYALQKKKPWGDVSL